MKNYIIEKILLPIDFSKSSINSIGSAIGICKRQKAQLTLIHVIDKGAIITLGNPGVSSENQFNIYKEAIDKKLNKLVEEISKQSKIKTQAVLETGNPVEVICQIASEGIHNIIVMGNIGNSAKNKKVGSTAADVVMHAPCPVLVVDANWDRHYFKKIVYPIRTKQRVFEKYNYIQPIIEKNNSELIIAGIADANNHNHITETIFSIDLLRNMCQEENIPYSTMILPCNNLASKIIETSNYVNADLIVISTHLDYDSNENLVEHFAKSIVNNSKCPVLCISPLLEK